MGSVSWRLQGEQIATCGCVWACPCQFMGPPSRGSCEAFIGFEVAQGHYGEVKLDGLRVAAVFAWPGAIHEGNGRAQVVVDERASEAQREAMLAIVSGQAGGGPFEVYASTLSSMEPPLFLPVVFESDREKRLARLQVDGVGEAHSQPIRNPVTGDPHRVRIDLPEGFEYTQAEIADAVSIQAKVGDQAFSFEHSYSQLNAFDWGNA